MSITPIPWQARRSFIGGREAISVTGGRSWSHAEGCKCHCDGGPDGCSDCDEFCGYLATRVCLVEIPANSGTIPDEVAAFIVRAANSHGKMLEACRAALRYDDAIAGCAARGEVDLREAGGGVATGDDLDALYADWQEKARAAVALVDPDTARGADRGMG